METALYFPRVIVPETSWFLVHAGTFVLGQRCNDYPRIRTPRMNLNGWVALRPIWFEQASCVSSDRGMLWM